MDMMTKAATARLDEPAFRGEPMPDGLTQPEQLYYQAVRLIYRQYRRGEIPREQAAAEKQQAIKALDEGEFTYRQHLFHVKLHRAFEIEFHKDSTPCSKCAECCLYKVITGLTGSTGSTEVST